MSDLTFLFAAFALLWAGTVGYLLRLASLRKRLEARMEGLEDRLAGTGREDA